MRNEVFWLSHFTFQDPSSSAFLPNILLIPTELLFAGWACGEQVGMGDGAGHSSGEKAPSFFFPVLTHPFSSAYQDRARDGGGISEDLGPQEHTTSQGGTSVEDVGSLYIPKEPVKGISLVCVGLCLHLPTPLHADQQPGK